MLKIASGVAPTDVYAPSQKSGPSLTSRLAAVMPPSPPSADVKVSSDTRDVNVLQEFWYETYVWNEPFKYKPI